MCEVNCSRNLFNNFSTSYNPVFRGNKKCEDDVVVDEFIKKAEKENKKMYEGRFLWSGTASIITLMPIVLYEIVSLIKFNKLNKTGNPAEIKQAAKNISKSLMWLVPAGFAAFAGLQYIFGRQTDKNFEKVKETFDGLNTDTSATLDSKLFGSGYVAATYYPFTDKIQLNKEYVNDPIQRLQLKKVLKHELVHAKQTELIVRSKDGIKKLNYAMLKNLAHKIEMDSDDLKEIEQLYGAMQRDKEGKYDNTVINIYALNLKLKDFVYAMHILINNKNATYNDIPMCVDENHYKKVIEQKGPLTPEEEQLAEKYYQACMTYSAPKNFFEAYNPKSSYLKNELEKEAYQK